MAEEELLAGFAIICLARPQPLAAVSAKSCRTLPSYISSFTAKKSGTHHWGVRSHSLPLNLKTCAWACHADEACVWEGCQV